MSRHPLARRIRGRGTLSRAQQRALAAAGLRTLWDAAAPEYNERLSRYVERFGSHWAVTLGLNPLCFPRDAKGMPNYLGGGWSELLGDLNVALLEIDEAYVPVEPRCNFGALAVVVHASAGAAWDAHERLGLITQQFTARSRSVCDSCGRPGHRCSDGAFWCVRCPECMP